MNGDHGCGVAKSARDNGFVHDRNIMWLIHIMDSDIVSNIKVPEDHLIILSK